MNNPSIQNPQWMLTHNYQLIYLYFKQYLLHISSTVRYIHMVNDHRGLPSNSQQPGSAVPRRPPPACLGLSTQTGGWGRALQSKDATASESLWGAQQYLAAVPHHPTTETKMWHEKQVSQTEKHPKSIAISIQILRKGHSHWHKSAVTKQLDLFSMSNSEKRLTLWKCQCQCEVSEENVIRQRSYCDFTLQYALYTTMFKSLGSGNAFLNAS